MLLKYLYGVKNGFYIDIGSHKPIKASNTFLLYLLGWRGICVDPLPSLTTNYKILRGKDVFINCGVRGGLSRDETNYLTFFHYKDYPDNSTFDEKSVNKLIELYDRHPTSNYRVPVIPVFSVIDTYKRNFNDSGVIHLLNIDIEGGELGILKDFFSANIFPWFICVEDLGYIAENLKDSKINSFVLEHDYVLVSKTFLSSIYMKIGCHKFLSSSFVRELNL